LWGKSAVDGCEELTTCLRTGKGSLTSALRLVRVALVRGNERWLMANATTPVGIVGFSQVWEKPVFNNARLEDSDADVRLGAPHNGMRQDGW